LNFDIDAGWLVFDYDGDCHPARLRREQTLGQWESSQNPGLPDASGCGNKASGQQG